MKNILNQYLKLKLSVNYRNIVKEWLLTNFKFTITKDYIFSNEEHIFRKLKQKIKRFKEKFDFRNSARYSTQKINLNKFFYIEKILQQEEENFSSKN